MTHGTTTCYVTHKCRCDECKAAWRAHYRDYAAKRRERRIAARARGEIITKLHMKIGRPTKPPNERSQRWWKKFWETAP